MTTTRTPDRTVGRDAGSVTLFFVVAVLALFAMVGLVVDGGTKIQAAQQAGALAEEAARAGGQSISLPGAVRGSSVIAEPQRAAAAARSYLAENDLTGSVAIADGGRGIVVNVSVTRPTVFLGMVGIDTMTVQGHARARLVRGVAAEEPA